MTRPLLSASLLAVALALAGCATQDESTGTGDEGPGSGGSDAPNNSSDIGNDTPAPASSNMCLEGAEDCDDTPSAPMPEGPAYP